MVNKPPQVNLARCFRLADKPCFLFTLNLQMGVSEIFVLSVVKEFDKEGGYHYFLYFALFLGIPYKITVYTGDRRSGGTDAQVYVAMNNKDSSHKTFLTPGKFEQKSVDIFDIDGPENLSPLTSLDVGHDNSGVGPGWFLDKVCRD